MNTFPGCFQNQVQAEDAESMLAAMSQQGGRKAGDRQSA